MLLDNIIKFCTGIFLDNFSYTNPHEKLWLVASSLVSQIRDSLPLALLNTSSTENLQKIYNETHAHVFL